MSEVGCVRGGECQRWGVKGGDVRGGESQRWGVSEVGV